MAHNATEEANELMEKYDEHDIQTVAEFIGFVIRQLKGKKTVFIKIVYLAHDGWVMNIGDEIKSKFSLSDKFDGLDIEEVDKLIDHIAEHAGVCLSNKNLSSFHLITCEAKMQQT